MWKTHLYVGLWQNIFYDYLVVSTFFRRIIACIERSPLSLCFSRLQDAAQVSRTNSVDNEDFQRKNKGGREPLPIHRHSFLSNSNNSTLRPLSVGGSEQLTVSCLDRWSGINKEWAPGSIFNTSGGPDYPCHILVLIMGCIVTKIWVFRDHKELILTPLCVRGSASFLRPAPASQSEPSIGVTWLLLTNQRPVSALWTNKRQGLGLLCRIRDAAQDPVLWSRIRLQTKCPNRNPQPAQPSPLIPCLGNLGQHQDLSSWRKHSSNIWDSWSILVTFICCSLIPTCYLSRQIHVIKHPSR